MAIKFEKDTLEIKNIQVENSLTAEYLAGLPEAQRGEAVINLRLYTGLMVLSNTQCVMLIFIQK